MDLVAKKQEIVQEIDKLKSQYNMLLGALALLNEQINEQESENVNKDSE